MKPLFIFMLMAFVLSWISPTATAHANHLHYEQAISTDLSGTIAVPLLHSDTDLYFTSDRLIHGNTGQQKAKATTKIKGIKKDYIEIQRLYAGRDGGTHRHLCFSKVALHLFWCGWGDSTHRVVLDYRKPDSDHWDQPTWHLKEADRKESRYQHRPRGYGCLS